MNDERWHFECPICGWDDAEAGGLAETPMIECELCRTDCGHIVLCRVWLEFDEKPE